MLCRERIMKMAGAGVCLVLQEGKVCVTEAMLLAVVQPDAVVATERQVCDWQNFPLREVKEF